MLIFAWRRPDSQTFDSFSHSTIHTLDIYLFFITLSWQNYGMPNGCPCKRFIDRKNWLLIIIFLWISFRAIGAIVATDFFPHSYLNKLAITILFAFKKERGRCGGDEKRKVQPKNSRRFKVITTQHHELNEVTMMKWMAWQEVCAWKYLAESDQ